MHALRLNIQTCWGPLCYQRGRHRGDSGARQWLGCLFETKVRAPSPLPLGWGSSARRLEAKLLVWREALHGATRSCGWDEGWPEACRHSSHFSPVLHRETTGESWNRTHESACELDDTGLLTFLHNHPDTTVYNTHTHSETQIGAFNLCSGYCQACVHRSCEVRKRAIKEPQKERGEKKVSM